MTGLLANATDRSPHTIGRYAAGSGDFYSRLVAGHDVTTRRAARVVQWLSDHWPADLAWPADISRPGPRATDPTGKAA
ncbi:MAG: hypothetical protein OXF78_06745 [Rhodospirillales bacterium]|nr:hypothetical protein [Rhodospirillales bacterium]